MKKILCINNGYYNIKTVNDVIFRSLYKEVEKDEILIKSDEIEYDGKIYAIGKGNPIKCTDKSDNIGTRLFILNAICNVISDDDIDINLLITCPPLYKKSQLESLPDYLKGSYNILWNGHKKSIRITDVDILSETYTAYFSCSNIIESDDIAIIDIGGYNTNVCCIVDGELEEYITLQHGIYHLQTELSQVINSRLIDVNSNVKPENVLRKIEKGLKFNGENRLDDVKADINNVYDNFVKSISDAINDKGIDISTKDKLATGGGGRLLFPYLKETYSDIVLSPNPIFENLNGLVKIAKKIYTGYDILGEKAD